MTMGKKIDARTLVRLLDGKKRPVPEYEFRGRTFVRYEKPPGTVTTPVNQENEE